MCWAVSTSTARLTSLPGMGASSTHRFSFFRAGGVDQVVLETGRDLLALRELDQKLWVALACPVQGTELDEVSLKLIDADGDGRIRVPEVLDAIDWMKSVLVNLDVLFDTKDSLRLTDFRDDTDSGKALRASARHILGERANEKNARITLADVETFKADFVSTKFNGDGVIPADSAPSPELSQAITDIIEAVGSVPDRCGKPGLDRTLLDRFISEGEAQLAWNAEGQSEEIHPFKEATVEAVASFEAVASKLEDYFARCRVTTYDARGATWLNPSDDDLAQLGSQLLTLSHDKLATLPIAKVESGRPLPLLTAQNPAWADRLARFTTACVQPCLGERTSLLESEFLTIAKVLAPHQAWQARRPSSELAKVNVTRLRELLAPEIREALSELILRDQELSGEFEQITSVEKALRLRRDLVVLLRNFVNFSDFYRRRGAVFQSGTLYLDTRACDLVLRVNDPARHAMLAGLSKAYLAYLECTRGAEKYSIVAAFTAGDVDHLMVGRNGVFYDRKGQDWDARITNIVENPISIRQAFFSPYKRLVRMIEEQVAKRAAEKEKASTEKVDRAAQQAATADQTAAAATPSPAPKKLDVGVVAAIGVAVAGAATFLSSILGMFLGLGIWMPLGLIVLVLAISAPSMLIAALKLRQRNLGPLLDANGWAINGRMRVNIPFGGSLTGVAALPAGSRRTMNDPFAERPSRFWLWLLLLLLATAGVLWSFGKLDRYLPRSMQAATHLALSESPPADQSSSNRSVASSGIATHSGRCPSS